jgi:hypothetical protein
MTLERLERKRTKVWAFVSGFMIAYSDELDILTVIDPMG